jgi:DNA-3-methyladenine glycosylase
MRDGAILCLGDWTASALLGFKVAPDVRRSGFKSKDGFGPVLPRPFYERTALQVARGLLGKVLVHEGPKARRAGRIVETEAYLGPHDLAAHSSKGRTPRTEVMFGPGGYAYVYFIYGMYFCFNIVTGVEGVASAVLVRGLEPLVGIPPETRTDGPARLTRALGIGRAENGLDLTASALAIHDGPGFPKSRLRRGPRVGVEYAGSWAHRPYRFWVEGSPGVSRAPKARPAAFRTRGR